MDTTKNFMESLIESQQKAVQNWMDATTKMSEAAKEGKSFEKSSTNEQNLNEYSFF